MRPNRMPEALAWIQAFTRQYNEAPTIVHLRARFCLNKNAAHAIVGRLERKGHVRRVHSDVRIYPMMADDGLGSAAKIAADVAASTNEPVAVQLAAWLGELDRRRHD